MCTVFMCVRERDREKQTERERERPLHEIPLISLVEFSPPNRSVERE